MSLQAWKMARCVRCGFISMLRNGTCYRCDSGTWEPVVGMLVCTCRMQHVRIAAVEDDGDTIVTEDGWRCSFSHCCDPVDHTWSHEDVTREARKRWPDTGPAICRHCGDHTDAEDPAPTLCVMCAKAGREP